MEAARRQRLPTPSLSSLFSSLKQDRESFLAEMTIARQDFPDAQSSQSDHRATVGQAVLLVGPGLVEGQGGVEIDRRLRKHADRGIRKRVPNQCDGGRTCCPAAPGKPG